MTPTRETIYAALAAKLAGLAGVKTFSRKLRHWTDVAQSDCPAVFMVEEGESVSQPPGQPKRYDLHVTLYVYVKPGAGKNVVPAAFLNPILDAIDAALVGSPVDNRLTLGGGVYQVRLDGDIEKDGGVLGDTSVAIVPIAILVP